MTSENPSAANEAVVRARAVVEALYRADLASQKFGVEILDVAPGRARIGMTVRTDMVNGHGTCHGGIIFAFADCAFAFACNSHGEPMVAAGASIEFLAPVAAGDRIIAEAREITRGARHGIYDVAVSTTYGTVLAQFRGRCARFRGPAQ